MAEKSDDKAYQGLKDEATQKEADSKAPQFNILRAYLKDCSLELPHAPQIFLETENPSIEVSLDIGQEKVNDETYETWVSSTVTAKHKEKVVFLVEAKQAGVYAIRNLTDEQMERVLNINCPTILFPYLRAQLSDLISRTGLPPLQLNDVNFEALYHQRKEAEQNKNVN